MHTGLSRKTDFEATVKSLDGKTALFLLMLFRHRMESLPFRLSGDKREKEDKKALRENDEPSIRMAISPAWFTDAG
jgi:hypothetical protein